MFFRFYVFCLFVGLVLAVRPAAANTNVLLILDSSGSMLERVDGVSKAIIAKRVLIETLRSLPDTVRVGLMTYGHRRRSDCRDIELISPIGTQQRETIVQRINGLQSRGETPIAATLDSLTEAFASFRGDRNTIVLVTDGAEECRGDPCAAARRLAATGLNIQINVVGFKLGLQQRDAVECIAREGNGHYYDAGDQATLIAAMSKVRDEVQTSLPTAFPQPVALNLSGPRINLLAEENGGQIILAPNANWTYVTNPPENRYLNAGVCGGTAELVMAFKDNSTAAFNTFEVLIPDNDGGNIKDFEILIGNEGPTGRFRSIGKFTTTNARMMQSPYQVFQFPEVTAKFVKIRLLNTWGLCMRITPWRLMGRTS